jgi:hypothetical protein
VILKLVPTAKADMFTGEIRPMSEKESRIQKQSLELTSVYKVATSNFILIFSFKSQPKNVNTHLQTDI